MDLGAVSPRPNLALQLRKKQWHRRPTASKTDEWKAPLQDILTRAPQTRVELQREFAIHGDWKPNDLPPLPVVAPGEALAYLRTRAAQSPPAPPGDWLYERFFWRLGYQATLLARSRLESPFAAEQREGLQIAFWMLQWPFLRSAAPQLHGKIADGLIVPFLGAASDDPTSPFSQIQLLRVVAEVYQNGNRHIDQRNALRSVIAAADPIQKNLADGARYQLAFELESQGQNSLAVALLEAITHDALQSGAKAEAQRIRKASGLAPG